MAVPAAKPALEGTDDSSTRFGVVSGCGFRCRRSDVGPRRRCQDRMGVRWCRCPWRADRGRDRAIAACGRWRVADERLSGRSGVSGALLLVDDVP